MAEGTLVITLSNQVAAPPPSVFSGTFITGWHVPTLAEWQTLITFLGGDLIAGGKLKVIGYNYWNPPNAGATNEVGFNGKGAGYRYEYVFVPMFDELKQRLYCWTSEETVGIPSMASTVCLGFDYNEEVNLSLDRDKKCGQNIILIKDDSVDPGTVTDYDGNVYPTVKIGTQVLMAENLRTSHYSDGTPIPIVADNTAWAALTTAGMCYYNNTP